MAYQTGTSTGISNLLDIINSFAVANGWTLDRRDSNSLSISSGTVFQNLFDNTTEIHCRLATGFSSGSAWNAQAGGNGFTQKSSDLVGSFTRYHLFTNATASYLYIVIEVDPGLFRHIVFGKINSIPGLNGGEFSGSVYYPSSGIKIGLFDHQPDIFASNYTNRGCVRVDADSNPTLYKALSGVSSDADIIVKSSDFNLTKASLNNNNYYKDWFDFSPTTFNLQTILIPIHFFVERPSALFSPIGYVDDLRIVNMTGIDPGATISIGSDQWLCFPQSVKGVSPSDNYGYAYKKLV